MSPAITDPSITDDVPEPENDGSGTAFKRPEASVAGDDPGEFDLAAWLGGATPTRRSVVIYQKMHLLGRLDELTELEYRLTGAAQKACLEEAKEVTAELMGSAITVVIEGRSSWWVEDLRNRLDKLKITDLTDRALYQLADQIVEPAGLDYEFLRAFAEVSDVQVAKLAEKMTEANDRGYTPNPRFLAKSSASTPGLT